MSAFGVVEVKHGGDCVQDAVGGAAGVPALEPGVVLDAHAGEAGDLLAAQPGHAAALAVGR
jgi:hypothetical protein